MLQSKESENNILMAMQSRLEHFEEEVNTKVSAEQTRDIDMKMLTSEKENNYHNITSKSQSIQTSNQPYHEVIVSLSQNQERESRQEDLQIPSTSVAQVIPEQIQIIPTKIKSQKEAIEKREDQQRKDEESWSEIAKKKQTKKVLVSDINISNVTKPVSRIQGHIIRPQVQPRDRNLNLVMHRVPENQCITQVGRRNEHMPIFIQLCEVLGLEEIIPVNIFCLGRPQEGVKKPIKVELGHKEDKLNIMRNLYILSPTVILVSQIYISQ